MQKSTSTALDYHEKEPITVTAMDGLDYFEAKIVDRLHLPNLNKISKVDQKVYLDEMKNWSYKGEIEIKWVSAGYTVYKNIHLIKQNYQNVMRRGAVVHVIIKLKTVKGNRP